MGPPAGGTPSHKTHLRRNLTHVFSYGDAPTQPVSGWTDFHSLSTPVPAPQQPLLPSWPQVLTSGDTDAFRCFQGSVSGTAHVHCFCVASHL